MDRACLNSELASEIMLKAIMNSGMIKDDTRD